MILVHVGIDKEAPPPGRGTPSAGCQSASDSECDLDGSSGVVASAVAMVADGNNNRQAHRGHGGHSRPR